MFGLILHFQYAYGWSPMRAGLANLPIIVTMIVATPLSEWLATRFGHRIACVIGALCLAGALGGLSWGVEHGYAAIAAAMVLMTIGLRTVMTICAIALVDAMPANRTSIGAATCALLFPERNTARRPSVQPASDAVRRDATSASTVNISRLHGATADDPYSMARRRFASAGSSRTWSTAAISVYHRSTSMTDMSSATATSASVWSSATRSAIDLWVPAPVAAPVLFSLTSRP